jgi:hypothetical protein
MAEGDKQGRKVSDREVRAHILRKLKEALPKIRETARKRREEE